MEFIPFPQIDLRATGQNIERLRKSRGYSVRELQTFFGFSAPQAIYKWQRGGCLPSVENLYALSKLLNIPMEDILVAAKPQQHRPTCYGQPEEGCSLDFWGRYYSGRSGWFLLCLQERTIRKPTWFYCVVQFRYLIIILYWELGCH